MSQKPTLGRIIHVLGSNRWLAAIVTGEEGFNGFYDQTFQVRVFEPHEERYETLLYSREGDGWRWPPKV